MAGHCAVVPGRLFDRSGVSHPDEKVGDFAFAYHVVDCKGANVWAGRHLISERSAG